MTRKRLTLVAALFAGFALTIGVGFSAPAQGQSREALARHTVRELFQSINTRHYQRTCELMSARFYRDNNVPDQARCVLALRIGFTWSQSFRFTIVGVRMEGSRALVSALANGAPGRIVLIEEAGRFKVVSVGGA
jgi:hypothetical protein